MHVKKSTSTESLIMLDLSQRDILHKALQLEEALINLRYEGKVQQGKNLASLKKLIKFLNEHLIPHISAEEAVYSYIGKHIPKTQVIIQVLKADHRELMESIENLMSLMRQINKHQALIKRQLAAEKLRSRGVYLVYLLRHHMLIEDESIFPIADQELSEREKIELLSCVRKSFRGLTSSNLSEK